MNIGHTRHGASGLSGGRAAGAGRVAVATFASVALVALEAALPTMATRSLDHRRPTLAVAAALFLVVLAAAAPTVGRRVARALSSRRCTADVFLTLVALATLGQAIGRAVRPAAFGPAAGTWGEGLAAPAVALTAALAFGALEEAEGATRGVLGPTVPPAYVLGVVGAATAGAIARYLVGPAPRVGDAAVVAATVLAVASPHAMTRAAALLRVAARDLGRAPALAKREARAALASVDAVVVTDTVVSAEDKPAVAALARRGVRVVLCSREDWPSARTVARLLDLHEADVYAATTRSAAAAVVRRTQQAGGRVAVLAHRDEIDGMEGLQDVTVLRGERGVETLGAKLSICEDGLRELARTLELARDVDGAIRRSRHLALGYHLAAVPIAAGALSPLLPFAVRPTAAALLSVTATLLALALTREAAMTRSSIRADGLASTAGNG